MTNAGLGRAKMIVTDRSSGPRNIGQNPNSLRSRLASRGQTRRCGQLSVFIGSQPLFFIIQKDRPVRVFVRIVHSGSFIPEPYRSGESGGLLLDLVFGRLSVVAA